MARTLARSLSMTETGTGAKRGPIWLRCANSTPTDATNAFDATDAEPTDATDATRRTGQACSNDGLGSAVRGLGVQTI